MNDLGPREGKRGMSSCTGGSGRGRARTWTSASGPMLSLFGHASRMWGCVGGIHTRILFLLLLESNLKDCKDQPKKVSTGWSQGGCSQTYERIFWELGHWDSGFNIMFKNEGDIGKDYQSDKPWRIGNMKDIFPKGFKSEKTILG